MTLDRGTKRGRKRGRPARSAETARAAQPTADRERKAAPAEASGAPSATDPGSGGAGGPEEARSRRLRIINAAEELFAEFGYEGVSLRQVAIKAHVPAALVGYHFADKAGLYRAVFELRTPAIVEQRRVGLTLASFEDDPEHCLEMILKAILVPMLKMAREENGGHFALLLAREASDPRSIGRGIVQQMLDPIALAVTERLRTLLPGRTAAEIHWAYHAIIGAMTYVMADGGRIARLSGGAAAPRDVDATIRHLVGFLLNGLRGAPRGKAGLLGRSDDEACHV